MTTITKLPALEAMRRTPHICLAEAVRSANRAITRRYSDYLQGAGLSAAQASLLMRLYYLVEPTMARLAEQMETDRTTMVRNVAILEKAGLVETAASEGSRAHRVRLTEAGFAALEAVVPLWESAQRDLKAELGDELWALLLGGMRRLVEIDGKASPRGR